MGLKSRPEKCYSNQLSNSATNLLKMISLWSWKLTSTVVHKLQRWLMIAWGLRRPDIRMNLEKNEAIRKSSCVNSILYINRGSKELATLCHAIRKNAPSDRCSAATRISHASDRWLLQLSDAWAFRTSREGPLGKGKKGGEETTMSVTLWVLLGASSSRAGHRLPTRFLYLGVFVRTAPAHPLLSSPTSSSTKAADIASHLRRQRTRVRPMAEMALQHLVMGLNN
jgi:hypothetical protein